MHYVRVRVLPHAYNGRNHPGGLGYAEWTPSTKAWWVTFDDGRRPGSVPICFINLMLTQDGTELTALLTPPSGGEARET